MRVNEIFLSIQGEGLHTGEPTVFLRLQGCNLRCDWCDTAYAQGPEGGEHMTVEAVASRIKELRAQWVCITGGEPLIQVEELSDLVFQLSRDGHCIEIETNGTIPLPYWGPRLVHSWVIDYKLPSSGMNGKHRVNWNILCPQDQVKFVVADPEDLRAIGPAVKTFSGRSSSPRLLVSPVVPNSPDSLVPDVLYHNRAWLQEVAQFCVDERMRFSLQVHKVIWGNKKGV